MLDASLCRLLLAQRPPALRNRLNDEVDALAMSSIVLMDLLYGAQAAAEAAAVRRAVEDFAARFEVLAFDRKASEHAADILGGLGRGGGSQPYDMMVAAHARSQGLTLVTDRPERFEQVRGLALEHWS